MEANELMIGDRIRFKYLPRHDDEIFDGVVNSQMFLYPSDFEIIPIPLTIEILDKNFRGYKRGSGALTDFIYELNEEYFIRAGAESIDLCMHYDDSEHAAHDDIYLVELRYVHTLQHALRLFGFDKEIEL